MSRSKLGQRAARDHQQEGAGLMKEESRAVLKCDCVNAEEFAATFPVAVATALLEQSARLAELGRALHHLGEMRFAVWTHPPAVHPALIDMGFFVRHVGPGHHIQAVELSTTVSYRPVHTTLVVQPVPSYSGMERKLSDHKAARWRQYAASVLPRLQASTAAKEADAMLEHEDTRFPIVERP